MGGGRGPRSGLGRRLARGPRHRAVSPDDHGRACGNWTNLPRATCGRRRLGVRQPGGGRRPLTETDPACWRRWSRWSSRRPAAIRVALRWTCKSTRQLADGTDAAEAIRVEPIAPWRRCCSEAGYSLQANRKTREGAAHPDRNAQFEYINAR